MTVAVCIRCGALKLGALVPCGECGFSPETDEERAQSIIITDHHLPEADLEAIGADLRNGQGIHYPEEAVAQYIEMFQSNPDLERQTARFIYGCFFLAIACIFGVAGLIYWLTG